MLRAFALAVFSYADGVDAMDCASDCDPVRGTAQKQIHRLLLVKRILLCLQVRTPRVSPVLILFLHSNC
jgi:hypothetical protein